MENTEKIGLVYLLDLKAHGRRVYANFPGEIVETYELKSGDRLRIKIIEVIRIEKKEGE